MYFRRKCGTLTHLRSAPCSAYLCSVAAQPLLTLETGVGRMAALTALDWALAELNLSAFVLFAGFAGALTTALHVGDVLLADTILDESGQRWATTWSVAGDVKLRRGSVLTTTTLIGSTEAKRRLGADHAADAVDMEAAYVAARCAERGVPFGCVRAISDTVDTPLSPALVDLLAGGRVSARRAAFAVARQPRLLGEFWRLQRDTRQAAYQLAIAVRGLIGAAHPNQ
jgi:adenosylhomocysteine nucleosidase